MRPRARWRSLWMRRLRDPAQVEGVLRHPAFVDRAPLEVALSRFFFAPFVHQEVVTGPAFARRAAWSRAAVAASDGEAIDGAVGGAFDRWLARRRRPFVAPSLLDEVRGMACDALGTLALGRATPQLLRLATDFDRGIKLVGTRDLRLRRALRDQLRHQPPTGPWIEAGGPLEPDALVDQVASVVFGTGVIQLTDVVTHALLALEAHPEARTEPSPRVLREVWRLYPVNASLTRIASQGVAVEGHAFAAGEAVDVVPGHLNRCGWREPHRFDPTRWSGPQGTSFAFGHGPRRCPAGAFSLTFGSALLDRWRERLAWRVEVDYPHRRSLARPAATAIGDRGAVLAVPPPTPGNRWRHAAVAMSTYPRAALHLR